MMLQIGIIAFTLREMLSTIVASIRFRKNRRVRRITAPLSFLFLCFYLVGNIQFEAVHQLIHVHDPYVSHSAEAEADPCHRYIYHNETESGCGHASHLVAHNKCLLCDVIVHRDEAFISNDFVFSFSSGMSPYIFSHAGTTLHSSLSLPSRAPPAI